VTEPERSLEEQLLDLAAERGDFCELVRQLADALHAAEFAPSRDLACAVLYLGFRMARELPEGG
jgi:hypothetical protein